MRELAVKIFLAQYITSAGQFAAYVEKQVSYGGKRGEDSSRERERRMEEVNLLQPNSLAITPAERQMSG